MAGFPLNNYGFLTVRMGFPFANGMAKPIFKKDVIASVQCVSQAACQVVKKI